MIVTKIGEVLNHKLSFSLHFGLACKNSEYGLGLAYEEAK
jgi:hypothetical protein